MGIFVFHIDFWGVYDANPFKIAKHVLPCVNVTSYVLITYFDR